MGLIKDFLVSLKNKNTKLSPDEEVKQLKAKVAKLEDTIKQMEIAHNEEINLIDREFLTWYNQQNIKIDNEDATNKQEQDKGEQQEELDLEELINE